MIARVFEDNGGRTAVQERERATSPVPAMFRRQKEGFRHAEHDSLPVTETLCFQVSDKRHEKEPAQKQVQE